MIDNVTLITEETWEKVNTVIVEFGPVMLGVPKEAPLELRCDSFAVETHVRHPTDVRLLHDATQKCRSISARTWNGCELQMSALVSADFLKACLPEGGFLFKA